MKKTNTQTNITPPPRNTVIAWVLALFSIILITGSVLAAGRCVPCKLNHYCVDGLRYQCPANTPVTQGMGAGALNECLTCVQRNGNSANPIYDDLVGDCVSCYEYNSDTPYWDGTTCSTCPSGTLWNSESLTCKEIEYTCAYEIAHGDKTLCLVENVQASALESIAPQSEADETEEFKAKYGITYTSSVYPDYWAGAMKYCQDKGLRLPSKEEWASIYKSMEPDGGCIEHDSCGQICIDSNADAKALFSFLGGNTNCGVFRYIWLNKDSSSEKAQEIAFDTAGYSFWDTPRNKTYHSVLCIK